MLAFPILKMCLSLWRIVSLSLARKALPAPVATAAMIKEATTTPPTTGITRLDENGDDAVGDEVGDTVGVVVGVGDGEGVAVGVVVGVDTGASVNVAEIVSAP